jgi:hypothetical protein
VSSEKQAPRTSNTLKRSPLLHTHNVAGILPQASQTPPFRQPIVDTEYLTSQEIFSLQRAVGNRVVGQRLARATASRVTPSPTTPHGLAIQRVQGLEDKARVKIARKKGKHGLEIEAGTIVTSVQAGRAYEVAIGNDKPEIIDHIFVFPENTDDNAIIATIQPLVELTELNNQLPQEGKPRLTPSWQQTQNSAIDAPQKTMDLLKHVESPPKDNVIEHAVDIANAFIQMHPFANANGRMGLYLLYKSAIKAGWLINLTALELHGIVLGEDNPKVEDEKDEVINKIISASKQIDMKEFDVEAYLSKCFSELMTLEVDRKVKAQGKEKKQRAMVNERMQQEKQASKAIGSATMEDLQGKLNENQWNALTILIKKGVAETIKASGHTHIAINFVQLNTLDDDLTLETWFEDVLDDDIITDFVLELQNICEYEEEEDE